MPIDRDVLRRKLVELRAELERQEDISESDRATVELDRQSVGRLSRIDALQVQAMALASKRRRKAELDRILAAMRRIDTADFGYCETCGDRIAERRLMHNPVVSTCIALREIAARAAFGASIIPSRTGRNAEPGPFRG
jgi:DnaK suppressor protein